MLLLEFSQERLAISIETGQLAGRTCESPLEVIPCPLDSVFDLVWEVLQGA